MTPAILLITYLSGPLEGHQAYVVYPSLADCNDATRAVSDTLRVDHKLTCEALDMVSSPRPRRNAPSGWWIAPAFALCAVVWGLTIWEILG